MKRTFTSADAALASIALQDDGERKTTIRVTRRDQSVVEGSVLEVNRQAVTLSASTGCVTVAEAEIDRLEISAPDRRREWMVAGVGIIAATALLVGIRSIPVFGADIDITAVVVALYFLATAISPFVLSRTRFGRWLQRWRPVFSASTSEAR